MNSPSAARRRSPAKRSGAVHRGALCERERHSRARPAGAAGRSRKQQNSRRNPRRLRAVAARRSSASSARRASSPGRSAMRSSRWEGLTRFIDDGRIEIELEHRRAFHSPENPQSQECSLRRLERRWRELGGHRVADRNLQAQRRRSVRLSGRRPRQDRQRPSQCRFIDDLLPRAYASPEPLKARGLTLRGDKRIGVIWHTQGSGKSLLMAFYAGVIIKHPAMQNPTLVVLTDRNDLDDQLFATFSMCKDLLRQTPRAGRGSRAICGNCSTGPPAASSSRPCRNSRPTRGPPTIRFSPTAGTLSSSPTRRTGANTASTRGSTARPAKSPTASPSICATGCPTPPSSASPARRSRRKTPTRPPCSATTSTSTTSAGRSRTARPCRSTTRADWRGSNSTRTRSRRSTPRSPS